VVKVWISARPMFNVVELTDVIVNRKLVTVFAGKLNVNADPSFGNDGTANVLPSLNVIVPPVI
jgi:hypothetical protein